MTGTKSKISRLPKTKRKTRPTLLLLNVKRTTSRISKNLTRPTTHSRIRSQSNNSKFRQCRYLQEWCLCQRMRQECNSSHNHSWANHSSLKASLASSACRCHQVRWVKDRCLWCLGCRACQCHRCSSLWVGCLIHSLINQCRSCQVNSHNLVLIRIHSNNPCHNRCRLLNQNQKRKRKLLKVGVTSWA